MPPPGYAPCYEALLPRDRMRIEPIKEYKHDFQGVRNLLGPSQSLTHTSFTPCPVDTVQVKAPKQKSDFDQVATEWVSLRLLTSLLPYRSCCHPTWSVSERSWQRIFTSSGRSPVSSRAGPMGVWVYSQHCNAHATVFLLIWFRALKLCERYN